MDDIVVSNNSIKENIERKVGRPNKKELGYNKQRFAKSLNEYIGERSLARYSMITGVSVSFLSKATRAALPGQPSFNTILRVCKAPSAGLVSVNDLLEAGGYKAIKELPKNRFLDNNETGDVADIINKMISERCSGMGLPELQYQFTRAFLNSGAKTISTCIDSSQGMIQALVDNQEYMLISAFCKDLNAETLIKQTVLANVFAVTCMKDSNRKVVYIGCNTKSMFEKLSFEWPKKIPVKGLAILYTPDNLSFTEEMLVKRSEGLIIKTELGK